MRSLLLGLAVVFQLVCAQVPDTEVLFWGIIDGKGVASVELPIKGATDPHQSLVFHSCLSFSNLTHFEFLPPFLHLLASTHLHYCTGCLLSNAKRVEVKGVNGCAPVNQVLQICCGPKVTIEE